VFSLLFVNSQASSAHQAHMNRTSKAHEAHIIGAFDVLLCWLCSAFALNDFSDRSGKASKQKEVESFYESNLFLIK